MELKAERVRQLNCAHCGAAIDPAACKPLTMATCPSCGKKTLAPAVFGEYQLAGGLGKGTTGGVLRATDASGRSVAIKIMTAIAADAGRTAAALDAARKLQTVDSPQIVKILGTGEYRQQPYVAMELIEGTTLAKALADSVSGKWNELRSVQAAAGIARGLAAAAQAGVLHTDLNPRHILIDAEGNPRLIAFSSAAYAGAPDPIYAAPEIRMGEPATAQSDMYSLGAVMFHLLTGRAPTDEDRGEELAKTLGVMRQTTVDVAGRLLALEPGDRPVSYDNLIKQLQAAEQTLQEGGHGLPSLAEVAEMMDKNPLLDEPAEPVIETAAEADPVDAMAELSAISIQMERTEKSASAAASPMPKPQPMPHPQKTPPSTDSGRKKMMMIAGGVAAMLVIGSLAFFLSGKKQPGAPVATAPATPAAPAVPAAVPAAEPVATTAAAATPAAIQTAANRFTKDPLWISLATAELKAASGATFSKLDDGSILVSGPHQPGESFQITAGMPKGDKKVVAIAIETLPHESLERGGPGRAGNFVLTTFNAAAAPAAEPAKAQPLVFSAAESDYEQTGSSAELAIDSDPKTGWAISPRYGASHWAIFWLKDPMPNTTGAILQLTLSHHPDYSGSIGRFRLWAMNQKPAPPPTPPPTVAVAPKAIAPVAPPKATPPAPVAPSKTPAPKAPATPPPAPAAPVFKPLYDAVTSMADRQTWYTADIINAQSSGGAILTKQADGSVLVSGKESEGDVYTVTLKTRVRNITGIRIETIPDKSLPNQGPGRTGDFVLAKVTAAQAAKKEGPFTPVALGDPAADVSTADFPPIHAIDEDPITGWAGGPEGVGKTHHIRFPLAEKFGASTENYLQITLAHHSKFALGRFLISVTSNAAPARLTTAPTAQLPTHVYSFIPIKPKTAASANGADLTINADASVLASGKNVPGDSYEVKLETAIANITAIQLETLTDPSLQKEGPGRLGGMFSIHTLTATVAPRATPDKTKPVEFEQVLADAEAKKGQEAGNLIDDKPQTVWTNAGDVGEARKAVFLIKSAVGGAGGSVITLKIDQKVNLGKFRVSVITSRSKSYIADLAKPKPEGPGLVELYYNLGGSSLYTDEQKKIWRPAPKYTPGKSGYVSANPLEPRTISKITNELHRSYLENLEGFKAAVPPGVYQVQLVFVEPVERQVSGFRQIDIYVEGKNMVKVINILQESGGFGKPAIKTLGPVTVSDGSLDIEFKGKGRILSGVAIIGKPAPAPAKK